MYRNTLFSILTIVIIGCLYSCSDSLERHEDPEDLNQQLKNYPATITIDNWKEFVHAPKSVIAYHSLLELEKQKKAVPNAKMELSDCSPDYNAFGVVKAMKSDTISTNINGIRVDGYIPLLDILTFSVLTEASSFENINWCSQDLPPGSGANGFVVCYALGDVDNAYELGDWRNGVTVVDLVLIQRHILGVDVFDNVHNLIAADANRDGQVNVLDLVALQELILGVEDEITYNPSDWYEGDGPWVFIEEELLNAAQEFYTNPDDEFDMSHPVFLELESSCASEIPVDIPYERPYDFGSVIAIKLGDVDYSRHLIALYN